MKLFLLPSDPDADGIVSVTDRDFHYLCHVRRIKTSESLEALSPSGLPYLATVEAIMDQSLVLRCTPEEKSETTKRLKLHLAVGLPKFDKLELIVRQAVETGLSTVTFLITDHCALKIKPDDFVKRSERLASIMKNAAQQSGCTDFPRLLPLSNLRSYVETKKDLFFLHTKPLENDHQGGYRRPIANECTVLIGPEGGFSEAEIRFLEDQGATAVFFDGPIMRVETACLFAAGAFFALSSTQPPRSCP
jgi:16S rRNA (uracil1498-N3)-methyltransferase